MRVSLIGNEAMEENALLKGGPKGIEPVLRVGVSGRMFGEGQWVMDGTSIAALRADRRETTLWREKLCFCRT